MFYVYEWFVKESGEVFYVGKGTKNRYKVKKHNKFFNDFISVSVLLLSLELLSDNEVELALSIDRVVKSPSPVNSKESDHREEHPHADSGRPLDLERIEIPDVRPAVTAFEEEERVNRGLRLKHDRITEFDSELVINVAGIIVSCGIVI